MLSKQDEMQNDYAQPNDSQYFFEHLAVSSQIYLTFFKCNGALCLDWYVPSLSLVMRGCTDFGFGYRAYVANFTNLKYECAVLKS